MNDNFHYCVPDNFKTVLLNFCKLNKYSDLIPLIEKSTFDFEVLNFAHYEGMKGPNLWNKKAIDFDFIGAPETIEKLKNSEKRLRNAVSKALVPQTTGLLLRNITFNIQQDNNQFMETLDCENEETLDTLSTDIRDHLLNHKPALALDRLHTYTVRYLRKNVMHINC